MHKAALDVKEQARQVAADLIEAAEADMELDTGTGAWQVRGDPATSRSWADVASHAGPDGLVAAVQYTEGAPTFPFGSHVAVVEVDTETGKVRLIRHVTVDDAGTVVNPLLAEGQRHGGIAQGVAQALLEEMVYDADGNPLTGTLADYAIDHRGRAAQLRAGRQRDADRRQPAGRQGHRRGRHDRLRARGAERRHRRAQPPRRPAHRHAAHPIPGLGRDRRRRGRAYEGQQ